MGMDTEFFTQKQNVSAMHTLRVWWPVLFRMALYFFIPFITELTSHLGRYANAEKTVSPNWIQWIIILGSATVGGLTAIRAYTDSHHDDYARKVNGDGFPPKPPQTVVNATTDQPVTFPVSVQAANPKQ